MTSQKIYCSPLNVVNQVATGQGISHLVSLINEGMMPETPEGIMRDHHLKLAMNDIAVPTQGLVIPAQSHIENLERFMQGWDQKQPMLFHCWAGISRSTAGVFISLCMLNPDMDESRIGEQLRESSPIAYPNRKLVQLADDYLGRKGRMTRAVQEMGRGEMAPEGRVFSIAAIL